MEGMKTQASEVKTDPASCIPAGLCNGDSGLMEELFRQHQPALCRYLVSITKNQDEADDLSQETWLRVLERSSQYRGGHTFAKWLRAIARNLVIDRARKKWRHVEVSCDQAPDLEQSWPSRAPSPYDLASEKEASDQLRRAVDRLQPGLQSVLRMHLENEHRLDDIARHMCLPPGTVRSRLHRGMAALRVGMMRAAES